MSDVKRVTLTTISDVVKKGGGGGSLGAGSGVSNMLGGPFGALPFDPANVMSAGFGSSGAPFGGGSNLPATKEAAGGSGGGGATTSTPTKKHKTVRLELNLFEPTAESFPEFNFSKLAHEEQKRLKKVQKKHHDDAAASNGFLSDPELDNDVARMARELERKYGSGTPYASKDKYAPPAKLDFYDRGAGYDEEDSFIDNTEAYDELIPQEIETVGGGFYINSGQLEFKQLSNFERPDDVHRMPKPKKRALSTTSESSDGEEPPAGAKKKAEESRPQQVAQSGAEKTVTNLEHQLTEEDRGNSAGNSGTETAPGDDKPRLNGHVAKKPKLVDNGQMPKGGSGEKNNKTKPPQPPGGTVTEGSKEKANGVKPKAGTNTPQTVIPSGAPTVAVAAAGGKKDENENDGGVKLIKTTTVKDMLRAKRDSLRKMEQEKKGRSSGSSRVSSSEAEEDGDGGGDEDDEDEENDEDDDEEDEEDEEDDEMGEGSEKNTNDSGSEEDIGSDSASSHESVGEKDAAAREKAAVSNGTEGDGQHPVPVGAEQNQQQQQQQQQQKNRKRKDCKLPDELPESLRKDVEALKEIARGHSIGGKLNYLDSKVAEVLVRIDDGARAAGNSTRNAVFRHLEEQLSISRQSLQLKLKKIHIRKLDGRSKEVMGQLEDTICDLMPLLLAKHELDCRRVAELRTAAQAAAAATAAAAAAASPSAGPTGMPSAGGPAMANGEKPDPALHVTATPQIRNPKKKFSWNAKARELLWELYSIRLQTFVLLRPRNLTEDDFVAEFLRNKLVPLWPKGWMRYEDLHKELDRRKKTLAKSPAPAPAPGKKQPMVVLPPLSLSALPSTVVDPLLMMYAGGGGGAATTVNGVPKPDGAGRSGGTPESQRIALPTSSPAGLAQPLGSPTSLSPNASHKRTSDHSICNIMNSPPLPPPPGDKHAAANRSQSNAARRSFDEDQLMLSPPNPAAEKDGSPTARRGSGGGGGGGAPSDPKAGATNRQRWSSRDEDSDSSIEITGEYNMSGGSGGGGGGSASGGGVISSPKSIIQPSLPAAVPGSNAIVGAAPSSATPLPVLNKEKYKNLIGAKNKATSSSGGASPVGSLDTPLTPHAGGSVGMNTGGGGGKYHPKHSPTGGGSSSGSGVTGTTAQQPGFATPSDAAGGGMRNVAHAPPGSGGSVRLKDSPAAIDLDVHQIMKDLKEFQELQQHHTATGGGTSRKTADTASIPSQQQHDRAEKSKNGPIVVD